MVTMRRRTLLGFAVGASAAVAGCTSSGRPAQPPASPDPAASVAVPPTSAPPLAPRQPTAVTPSPGTAPGSPFGVGTRTLAFDRGPDRPLPVSLWYPAGSAQQTAQDAPVAAGRFPVVLFSHGLTARPSDYQDVFARWARAGFVVAAPAYPYTSGGVAQHRPRDVLNQPADASEVLSQLLAKDTADDPLNGHLDAARVAAAGHSAGAITTAALFTSARDTRLKAGFLYAGTALGSAPFTGPPAPVLVAHGTRDDTVPYDYGRRVFEAVPWSRAMLTVRDGGHVIRSRDFEVITGTTTEFLRWSLYGDPTARQRIATEAARGDIATLDDQL
jgi:dienelactone hydrolase